MVAPLERTAVDGSMHVEKVERVGEGHSLANQRASHSLPCLALHMDLLPRIEQPMKITGRWAGRCFPGTACSARAALGRILSALSYRTYLQGAATPARVG